MYRRADSWRGEPHRGGRQHVDADRANDAGKVRDCCRAIKRNREKDFGRLSVFVRRGRIEQMLEGNAGRRGKPKIVWMDGLALQNNKYVEGFR